MGVSWGKQPFFDQDVLIRMADDEKDQESDPGDRINPDVDQIDDANRFFHLLDSLLSILMEREEETSEGNREADGLLVLLDLYSAFMEVDDLLGDR